MASNSSKLTPSDFSLFLEGKDYQLYEKLGAHPIPGEGVRFAVWAPAARSVSLACDLNHFSERSWKMELIEGCGVWQLLVPGAQEGLKYKFAIEFQDGSVQLKSDPFAFAAELRPNNASIVASTDHYVWRDQSWLEERRGRQHAEEPMNIYEVHLGSWRCEEGAFKNYRTIALELAEYCQKMGYTHVELMPITEHPLDESWGYQVTGYFAPTSRFGTAEDFQFFVDHMHERGIYVILDWVGGHFPADFFALAQFDGTHLFEYEDPQKGFHPQWNTLIFDYGKPQVGNFLIASVLFWAEKMHLDGFRFDAVSSIIYLSFAREEGGWTPNEKGGAENLEAIAFLREMNQVVHKRHPGVVMIAEEATVFEGVSHPVESGGLGFDFKSNLGWMNDSLRYFETDFPYRKKEHELVVLYMTYAYQEHYALFLSHDEVVHEKRSLISKMPGEPLEQLANLRLLYTMMMTLPGKKLWFMGGEIAQWNEWSEQEELHWHLLEYPSHRGMQECVKAMNHLYLQNGSFWELDHDPEGFEWVSRDDSEQCVISYLRKGRKKTHFVIHNFSQNHYREYTAELKGLEIRREVFNSDEERFMGEGITNGHFRGGTTFHLAPFVTAIFEVDFESE